MTSWERDRAAARGDEYHVNIVAAALNAAVDAICGAAGISIDSLAEAETVQTDYASGEIVTRRYKHQDRWYKPVSDPDEIDERVNWQITTQRGG